MAANPQIIAVLQNFCEQGLKNLEEKGSITPAIFAQTRDDGLVVLPLSFLHDDTKDCYFDIYRKIMQAYDVKYYIVMVEAWRANLTDEQRKAGMKASQSKNKKDCANFFYVSRNQTVLSSHLFHKDPTNGKVVFISEPDVIELPSNQRYFDPCLTLLDSESKLTDIEKDQLKILLPVKTPEEIMGAEHLLN